MTGPSRSCATLIGVATLAGTLTACSTSSVGGAPAAPSNSAPSRSTAQSNTPLAGLSPCATLDRALAGQGYPPAQPSTADPEHGCISSKPQVGSASLDLQDGQNYQDAVHDRSKAFPGKIHDRAATLERDIQGSPDGCVISMEVKPSSRAIVALSLFRATTDQDCDQVSTLAQAIEPLLPANG